MNDFNEVFSMILKEYEKTKSLEAAVAAAHLTEEQKQRVSEAFAQLDAFDQNAKSLREAKEEGDSRKKWLAESILKSAQDRGLDDAQVENLCKILGSESEK